MDTTMITKKDNSVVVRVLSALFLTVISASIFWCGLTYLKLLIIGVSGIMLYELYALHQKQVSVYCYAGYVALSMGSLLYITTQHVYHTLWLVVVVSSNDIFAYFIGRWIRGPKLAPTISPNKTWSGFIGGITLGSLIAFSVGQTFHIIPFAQTSFVFYLFCVFMACIGSFGDLLESKFKRHLGIKDISHSIPGHGGFIDRFDSLMLASLVYLLFLL